MVEHALFSPSSLYRVVACPGSVREAAQKGPQPSSIYAEHGTMLHEWVNKSYVGGRGVVEQSSLDPEDIQHVLTCLDFIEVLLKTCSDDVVIGHESSVNLAAWGIPDIFGTPDFWVHDVGKSAFHLPDWKFGQGVQVFANRNEQLMTYSACILGFPPPVDEITVYIVQPPLDWEDHYTFSANELKEFIFDVLVPAKENAESNDPTFCPGEKQCRFCPAAMSCRHRYKMVQQSAVQIFKSYSSLPDVTPEELVKTWKEGQEYAQYYKELCNYVLAELMKGKVFPGVKAVSGRSNRKWLDEETAKKYMLGLETIETLYTEPKLISPSQAEKQDRKLKKDEMFKKLITKPKGKPQLAVEEDKRPALEPDMEAGKVFQDFTEEE